jgi:hypothetical protein
MRADLEKILVDSLRGTLHVMLCAGNSSGIHGLRHVLSGHPLYNFFNASSRHEVDTFMRQVPVWHCVVAEASMGFEESCFLPILTSPSCPSVLVIDGREPARIQRFCTDNIIHGEGDNHSAAEHLKQFDLSCFLHLTPDSVTEAAAKVQRRSIERKLVSTPTNVWVRKILDILFTTNPLTVECWAEAAGVRARKFQREFKHISLLAPKKMLALYHAYRIAFEHCAKEEERKAYKGVQSAYVICDRDKTRIMEYVLTHQSALLSPAG